MVEIVDTKLEESAACEKVEHGVRETRARGQPEVEPGTSIGSGRGGRCDRIRNGDEANINFVALGKPPVMVARGGGGGPLEKS